MRGSVDHLLCSIRQHTSAYVSIRQHASAYVSMRQHTSACVSMRQHASAYVSIRQHPSAYVSIRKHTFDDRYDAHGACCLSTYAYVCSRMLTYAYVCPRMLTYADRQQAPCLRMLTYAHVCSRMLTTVMMLTALAACLRAHTTSTAACGQNTAAFPSSPVFFIF